ncbi:MAG: saccharopine dehydrogenase NADP-binding domain-containing protein, partial [Candidatus Thermoplasmatota archaeon]|nr:saccharopine dehydrogenase NADP-binding domain-containing protein [Candidatus Thermoplasmatota archaeon]
MQRIVVLGGGMVGGLMARDMSREAGFEVVVADRDPKALARLATGAPIEPVEADLADAERVKKIVSDCDMVIGAVPGFLGLQTLKAVLETGRNICDISFMPEDPRCLDNLAKEKRATAVVDCGVAPGMSNMICGRLCAEMDVVEDVTIFVGGLPAIRRWPHEYKAP